ncbi:MAG: ribosome biogenesis GTP-binding protein YsxC [Bdellovibrionales bacterium]|nr:ribosome biogenesis GTP-binding protein YsxC [Bdellovibrionales bacterium]
MIRTLNAEFIGSYPNPAKLPLIKQPQFLFIGRSNAGKSTLINRIAGQKKLARTSSMPGRTQAVNLFRLNFSVGENNNQQIVLADLPGYGFAKVSKKERRGFENQILQYIVNAQNVAGVFILQDCRREPEDEEFFIRDLAFEHGHVVLIVLTKVDKLKKNEIKKIATKIAQSYSLETDDVILSGEKIPLTSLFKQMQNLL